MVLHDGELSDAFISSLGDTFGAVIVTIPLAKSKLIRINEVCRNHHISGRPAPVPFVLGLNLGLTWLTFTDMGDHHSVHDFDGDERPALAVQSISDEGIITLSSQHNVVTRAFVKLSNLPANSPFENMGTILVQPYIESVPDLNSAGVQRVDDKGQPKTIQRPSINKLIKLSSDSEIMALANNEVVQGKLDSKVDLEHSEFKGSLLHFVQGNFDVRHNSFAAALNEPSIMNFDARQGHYDNCIFWAYAAFWMFEEKNSRLPNLHDEKDAADILAIAKEITSQKPKIKKELGRLDETVSKLSLFARSELPVLSTLVGGLISIEVMKKCGKFSPLSQFYVGHLFYLASSSTVPPQSQLHGSRYDNHISIFGTGFQRQLGLHKVCACSIQTLFQQYVCLDEC